MARTRTNSAPCNVCNKWRLFTDMKDGFANHNWICKMCWELEALIPTHTCSLSGSTLNLEELHRNDESSKDHPFPVAALSQHTAVVSLIENVGKPEAERKPAYQHTPFELETIVTERTPLNTSSSSDEDSDKSGENPRGITAKENYSDVLVEKSNVDAWAEMDCVFSSTATSGDQILSDCNPITSVSQFRNIFKESENICYNNMLLPKDKLEEKLRIEHICSSDKILKEELPVEQHEEVKVLEVEFFEVSQDVENILPEDSDSLSEVESSFPSSLDKQTTVKEFIEDYKKFFSSIDLTDTKCIQKNRYKLVRPETAKMISSVKPPATASNTCNQIELISQLIVDNSSKMTAIDDKHITIGGKVENIEEEINNNQKKIVNMIDRVYSKKHVYYENKKLIPKSHPDMFGSVEHDNKLTGESKNKADKIDSIRHQLEGMAERQMKEFQKDKEQLQDMINVVNSYKDKYNESIDDIHKKLEFIMDNYGQIGEKLRDVEILIQDIAFVKKLQAETVVDENKIIEEEVLGILDDIIFNIENVILFSDEPGDFDVYAKNLNLNPPHSQINEQLNKMCDQIENSQLKKSHKFTTIFDEIHKTVENDFCNFLTSEMNACQKEIDEKVVDEYAKNFRTKEDILKKDSIENHPSMKRVNNDFTEDLANNMKIDEEKKVFIDCDKNDNYTNDEVELISLKQPVESSHFHKSTKYYAWDAKEKEVNKSFRPNIIEIGDEEPKPVKINTIDEAAVVLENANQEKM